MKGKFSSMWRVVIALALVAGLSLVAAVPAMAAGGNFPTTADTNNDDAIAITDASGITLESISATGTIYIWVFDDETDTTTTWNTDAWEQESVTVTLKVQRGDGSRAVATKTYSAIERTVDSKSFRTAAIPVSSLGVEPGYRLLPSLTGADLYGPACTNLGAAVTAGPYYIQAQIEFVEGGPYDIDGTMTLRVKDDSLNTVATSKQDASAAAIATIDKSGVGSATPIKTNLKETGNDTGVFEYVTTPNTADADIWCGNAMAFVYQNANTTLGAPVDPLTKTAYVYATSPSSVSFIPGTILPTVATVDVVVIDRDESSEPTANSETIFNAVVVKSLAADDSVIDSLIVPTLTEVTAGGQFGVTVTFGTLASQLVITGAAKLQATYTDPNDPTDVSTATAAIGATVDLYDDTGALNDSYTTIQAAIDDSDADSGWTVKVSEAYNSADESFPITIDVAGLTVESVAGAASTTIDASGFTAIQILADDVTFDGFTVVITTSFGIVTKANDTTITNNIVTCALGDKIGINVLDVVANATVSDNQLEGCTIYLDQDVTASTISGNEITTGSIVIEDDISGLTVTGNTVTESLDAGAIQFGGRSIDDVLIQGNTLSDNDQSGIFVSWWSGGSYVGVTNVIITGNEISSNGGSGILIEKWDAANAIKFNNISGNTDYGIKNTTSTDVDATHNWWGTSDPSAGTFSGSVTYEPCLGASVSVARFVTGATFLNAKTTVGVQVSGVGNQDIGVALYAANPKATPEFTPFSFFDVYVSAAGGATEVVLKFYAAGIDENSVVYAWNELQGEWVECSHQDYNSFQGFVWVKLHLTGAAVPTVPTIEDLAGLPFAISGVPAPPDDPWVYDTNGDGVIQKSEAVKAVWDYFDGLISKELAIEVLWLYFG